MSTLQDRIDVRRLFDRMRRLPLGTRIMTRLFQWAAPYSGSVPVEVLSMQPGVALVRMRDKRRVHNHLGTVHAIALCNLAETAMAMVAVATLPRSHRWIPRAMRVEYLAKARGTLQAEARLELPPQLPDKHTVTVPIRVHDPAGTLVFTAEIDVYVTRRS